LGEPCHIHYLHGSPPPSFSASRFTAGAVAAYWAAVERKPKDKIALRQGIRVVGKNSSEEKSEAH
jgi:hypothetical protein